MKLIIVGLPAFFWGGGVEGVAGVGWGGCGKEHKKNETCLQRHRSKWLSARFWVVCQDHQYTAGDFRDIQT